MRREQVGVCAEGAFRAVDPELPRLSLGQRSGSLASRVQTAEGGVMESVFAVPVEPRAVQKEALVSGYVEPESFGACFLSSGVTAELREAGAQVQHIGVLAQKKKQNSK